MESIKKHVIIANVDNKPGVVSRVSGLFTRRGYNIESFVTSVTQNPEIYHLTISVICTDDEVALLIHQLGRLVEVIDIYETSEKKEVISREFMLIKVKCPPEMRAEVMKTCEMLKTKIVGMGENNAVIEVTGDSQKLDGIILSLEHLGTIEIVRSGVICVDI